MPKKMHENEVATDATLVRRLLRSQHPQWADLPIERVASSGTDNAMYRLGDELAVRLPRIHWALDSVAKEQQWLPRLAPQLPLDVPVPVASGAPAEAFPYPWTIVRWLPGELAALERIEDPVRAARDLAAFVRALQAVDAHAGPTHKRGHPVRLADVAVRNAIAGLRGELDADAVSNAWDRAIAAPDYHGSPVWFHGDLSYLNLLAQGGELTGVIDWGCCGVGDPAIDSIIAWRLFTGDARETYRDALGIDAAMWERGKGWVLTGVVGIPYYRDTNPALVADQIRGIQAVLEEQ